MKRGDIAFVAILLIIVGSIAAYSFATGLATSSRSSASPSQTPTLTTSSSSTSSSPSASSSSVSTTSPSTLVTTSTPGGPIRHVIIILMENEGYGQVIGNPSAPYENSLASEYAIAANYYAVSHPSLPNYLALVGGGTFGVASDCSPGQCSLPNSTVADLLLSHGLSWKEYAESMPANCSQTDSADGLYVTKHDPFVYFSPVTGNSGTGPTSAYCDSHVVPFSQFWLDLQGPDLPNYSFITPNTCDDAHSCPLSEGDAWLSTALPRIINSSYFASSAVFIVYDEGAGSTPGSPSQVPCILVSPFAKPGYVSTVHYTHYSLLATVESIFHLGSLGRNDSTAGAMSDLFSIGI